MFEIPLAIPPGASYALLGVVIAGVAGYCAAKLLARIRRVEDALASHEETCERHWKLNDQRWVNLDANILDITQTLAYIKGKLDGGDQ